MARGDVEQAGTHGESRSELVVNGLLRILELAEARGEPRLPKERDLAEQLGIGRTALREGLSKLESLQMIAPRQGSGLYIVPTTRRSPEALVLAENSAPLSAKSIGEAMAVRALLEIETAKLAALNHERNHLNRMALEIERLERCGGKGVEAAEADQEFHRALSIASGNNTLAQFVDLFLRLSWRRRLKYFESSERGLESVADHKAILDAIASGVPERACAEVQQHLNQAERFWATTKQE